MNSSMNAMSAAERDGTPPNAAEIATHRRIAAGIPAEDAGVRGKACDRARLAQACAALRLRVERVNTA